MSLIVELLLYGNIDMHIIKIKEDVVEKDPFKRKVSESMLESLAAKLRGNIYEYRLNRGVQEIIEQIIQW